MFVILVRFVIPVSVILVVHCITIRIHSPKFTCLYVFSGFVGAVHRPLLNKLVFAFMFLAYLTVFKLGQTFLWFQWDTLLLEVGGLAILVAPTRGKTWFMPRPRDHITMMTVRFLLFRYFLKREHSRTSIPYIHYKDERPPIYVLF